MVLHISLFSVNARINVRSRMRLLLNVLHHLVGNF